MNSIELTAPAKVNLILRVLSKRRDSYHNIFTLFERISLADRIKIDKIAKGIIVTCDKPVTAKPRDNIAYKAARLILRTAKMDAGVKIHIKKRIPVAAGLGGGSSDAAAVLVGINRLFKLNIDKERLMRLGAKLGADVPFFIFDAPFAIGRGIGDRLEKFDLNTKFHHILIYPGFKVATKDVYGRLDLKSIPRNSSRSSARGLPNPSTGSGFGPELIEGPKHLTGLRDGDKMALPTDLKGLEGLLHNDLEAVVVAKRPVIGKIIKCLVSSLGRKAMVSGSGPSVFCLCRTRKEAMGAKKKLFDSVPEDSRKRWRTFIAATKV